MKHNKDKATQAAEQLGDDLHRVDNGEAATFDDVEELNPEVVDDFENIAAEELSAEDKLTSELNDTKAALEKEKKEYLFLMADFDNFRKRVVKKKPT